MKKGCAPAGKQIISIRSRYSSCWGAGPCKNKDGRILRKLTNVLNMASLRVQGEYGGQSRDKWPGIGRLRIRLHLSSTESSTMKAQANLVMNLITWGDFKRIFRLDKQTRVRL